MGATQASAGVLAPYIEAHEHTAFLELTVRSFGLYDEFIERTASDSGLAVTYRRTGTLDVALQEENVRVLHAKAALLARRGVACELVDAQAAPREAPPLAADA